MRRVAESGVNVLAPAKSQSAALVAKNPSTAVSTVSSPPATVNAAPPIPRTDFAVVDASHGGG